MAKKRKRKKKQSSSPLIILIIATLSITAVAIYITQSKAFHQSSIFNEISDSGKNSDSNNVSGSNIISESDEVSLADSTEDDKSPANGIEQVAVQKSFSPAGTYVCTITNENLSITFSDNDSSDENAYSVFQWNGALPTGYKGNRYAVPTAVFYDENHGFFFSLDGSGAGSSYYHVYYTDDGCQTWTEASNTFQKNNSDDIKVMTDAQTLAVIESGIGYTFPAIAVISYKNSVINYTAPKGLSEMPSMIASIKAIRYTKDGSLKVNYTTFDSKDSMESDINILNYMP